MFKKKVNVKKLYENWKKKKNIYILMLKPIKMNM